VSGLTPLRQRCHMFPVFRGWINAPLFIRASSRLHPVI
jgi:hypothetical protein